MKYAAIIEPLKPPYTRGGWTPDCPPTFINIGNERALHKFIKEGGRGKIIRYEEVKVNLDITIT